MNITSENRYVVLALRLLLEPIDSSNSDSYGLCDVQWDVFLKLAQKNLILIRIYDQIVKMNIPINEVFTDAAVKESGRVCSTLELIGKIGDICYREGIEFVFTKAFQHYPDMGHDVDLFVSDRSRRVDTLIAKQLGASSDEGSLFNWISGKAGYIINEYLSPVEIHHARLGHIGEHNIYPGILVKNKKKFVIDGITTFIPSSEDKLILQAIQRIYGHLYIRLSDIIHTVRTIREDNLNWDYMVGIARQIGIFDGFCCYLSYVDQVHHSIFEKTLLPQELNKILVMNRGKVQFRAGYYRFPVSSVLTRVYTKKFLTEVISRNWESVGRLCLLPPFALITKLMHLARWSDWFLKNK